MRWLRRTKPGAAGRTDLDEAVARQREIVRRVSRDFGALDHDRRIWCSTAFSAAALERAYRRYDALPEEDQHPYALVWRPVVDDLWAHLASEPGAYQRVCARLGTFYLSEYCDPDGPSDLDDADEASAAYYAVNCLVLPQVEYAGLVGQRALDGIDRARPDDWAAWHAEASRQERDLDLLVEAGREVDIGHWQPDDLLAQLRAG